MNSKIEMILWTIATTILFVVISLNILRGGLFDLMRATLLLAPFLFILFIRCRSVWHVMIPIALVAVRLRLPVYGLQQLTPMLLMAVLMVGTSLLDVAINRVTVYKKRSWEDNAVFIVACFLSFRLLLDRPGFVALGMGEGGFISAFNYTIAAWTFFAVQRVVSLATFTRKQLRVAAVLVFVLFVNALLRNIFVLESLFTRMLGEAESWMLTAMLLSLIITSPTIRHRYLLYSVTSFSFLYMAAISTYRARAIYILSEVLAIAYLTNIYKRMIMVLLIVGTAGIIGAIAFQEHMPPGMARFLSLFTQIESDVQLYGAVGWQDNFRGKLYGFAWEQIRLNPFLGRGFGLNVGEALSILTTVTEQTQVEILALGGSYHNSIVALAVIAGIPIALLFTAIVISIPIKFVRMLQRLPKGDMRTWGLVILGFFCASMSMLLLNGGPREFFVAMIITGYMKGMMRNIEAHMDGRFGQGKALESSTQSEDRNLIRASGGARIM